jgi:AcrR family transcriptional regulator
VSVSRPEVDVRSELLAAGERVFAAKGYAAATIDDVIKESATSRASYYRYFSGKEQLFDELSRDCFRAMRAAIRDLADVAGPPVGRDGVLEVLERYHALHTRFGGVIRAWTELTGPADSPMRASGRAAVEALSAELERVLARLDPTLPAAERALRARLLFVLIERSSFYVSNRVSRVAGSRLPPTLTTMVERAYLGGA